MKPHNPTNSMNSINSSNSTNFALKTLALIIALTFTTTTIALSAPELYLRQRPAAERRISEKVNSPAESLISQVKIDPAAVKRQQALIKAERDRIAAAKSDAADSAEGEFAGFHTDFLFASRANPAHAEERARLIKAGQTSQALGKLGIVIGAGGEGTRLIQSLIKEGLITEDEARTLTKVAIAVTPIRGFGTLYLRLKLISHICKKYNVDIPVCVALSPLESNEPILTKFLDEHRKDFDGIKSLETVIQGLNTTYSSERDEIARRANGEVIFNPNGIGGILQALVESKKIEWFREKIGPAGKFLYLNCDEVLDEEFFYIVAGATFLYPEKNYFNFTTPYPEGLKLGVPCFIKRGDQVRGEIIEFAQRPKFKGLEEACSEAEKRDQLQTNLNMVAFSLSGVEEKIQRLPERVLLDKNSVGYEGNTDKIERWITDMMAFYTDRETLLVAVDQYIPIKDITALKTVRGEYAGAMLKKAKQLGIEVEEGGLVEFAPDFDLDVNKIPQGIKVGKDDKVFFDLNTGPHIRLRRETQMPKSTFDIEIPDPEYPGSKHTYNFVETGV